MATVVRRNCPPRSPLRRRPAWGATARLATQTAASAPLVGKAFPRRLNRRVDTPARFVFYVPFQGGSPGIISGDQKFSAACHGLWEPRTNVVGLSAGHHKPCLVLERLRQTAPSPHKCGLVNLFVSDRTSPCVFSERFRYAGWTHVPGVYPERVCVRASVCFGVCPGRASACACVRSCL